ncbi:MAG: InlB B-repeat-containing protein [Clostridiales bacterium]|nr:InlB B-repeat-containing protein [Clostridiales bacterium]
MKKRLLAAVLCLVMLISCVPSFAFRAQASELPVITCSGSAQSAVSFPRNERITLTAEGGAWYQWQIKVNDSLWVNISGETGETLDVSYAMIANLCQGDTAYLRVVADGERKSEPVAVTADEAKIKPSEESAAAPVILAAPQVVVSNPSTGSSSADSANTEAVAQAQAALTAAEAAANAAAEIAIVAEEDAAAKQAAYYEAQNKADAAKAAMDASAVTTEIPAETSAEDLDENGNPVVVKPAETVVTYDPDLQAAYATAQAEADAAWQVYSEAAITLADAEANLEAAQAAVETAAAELEAAQNQTTGENPGSSDYDLPRNDATNSTYNVVINYVFENNEIVADPYTASLAAGSSFSATVTFPVVQGYLPYLGETQQNSLALSFTAIDQDYTYNVVYKPTNVDYTVIHYQQNLNDDKYTEVLRETKQDLTNNTVPEVAKEYQGFYALLYEKPEIAADGSTVVEVYYDRYYYLMNFDLDGGYGVEPIYARYGAPISVDNPTKPGYTFVSWTPSIPSTMPDHNTSYTASWKIGESGFTVVFWYENANDDGYSVAGTYKPADVTPGTEKKSEEYKNQSFTGRDDEHFTYNAAKAETVTVKGDGSTVLNVYYTRNTYTLKFRELDCDKWLFHTHDDSCYKVIKTITAKYQADIHGNFPIKDGNDTIWWNVPNNCNSFKPGTQLGSIDTMPGENITFTRASADSGAVLWYYVETLNGESGDYTHDGKNFKLYKKIDIEQSGRLTYTEEFHNITGFTQWWSDPAFSKMEQGGTTNGVKKDNYLCYTRNSYDLKFYNYNAYVDGKGGSVQYEAPLSSYHFVPEYPANLEKNAYVFDGWYTTDDCYEGSKAELSTMTMPASDVILYAKWVPKTHKVEFYLDQAAMQAGTKLATHPAITVPHGSKADPTPAKPTNGNYKFVGWFYMENGVEKAFDFANMPVTKDMKVYGKWSSDTLMQYFVYYKIKGEDTEIAASTTGSALAGSTKTFDAKGGTDLYADYQEGYFPITKSHSMTIDIEDASKNSFTFEYVQAPAVPYTVHYVTDNPRDDWDTTLGTIEIDGKTYYKVAATVYVEDNHKAVVTENFKPVNNYMPDAYQKRLVVSVDENGNPDTEHNVIIFYYTQDNTHAYYKITHYTENLGTDSDGKPTWTEYASSQAVGDIGQPYSAEPMTIPGFTYDSTVSGTVTSGVLTANGLELKLYYTRNSYPYQVRYLEQGTGKQLADPKNDTGKYGEVVSESAIEIANYTAVDPTSQTLNIRIEESQSEAKLNIITFYYTENEATINYVVVGPDGCGSVNPTSETLKVLSGTAQGSTADAKTNYRFVGWYKDEACTIPVAADWVTSGKITPQKTKDYDPSDVTLLGYEAATYYAKFEYDLTTLTITKSGAADANDGFIFDVVGSDGTSFTVSVKGNGSVTIAGVKVGTTYTITERGDWAWRYAAAPGEITLGADSTKNAVTITNSVKNKYLLDGSAYARNNSVLSNTAE